MKLHQLKIKKGTLEMIVTLAAGLLEDVIKLKLQDAVGLLFERNRRRIALYGSRTQRAWSRTRIFIKGQICFRQTVATELSVRVQSQCYSSFSGSRDRKSTRLNSSHRT